MVGLGATGFSLRRGKVGHRSLVRRAGGLLVCFLALVLTLQRAGAEAEKTELSFVLWQDEKSAPIWEEIFRGFEAEHPDIQIKPITNTGDNYLSKVTVMMTAGSLLDLVMIDYIFAPTWMISGYLTPLDPYIARDHFNLQNIWPGSLQSVRYQGHQYALPMDVNNQALYYNPRMFDTAGLSYPDETWTWETFLGAARKLTRDANNDGKYEQQAFTMSLYWEPLAPWVWNAGGDWFNSDRTQVTLNQPPAIEAFQYLADLINVYHAMPASGNPATLFTNQQAATWGTGYWEVSTLRSVPALDWDVAPLPYKIVREGRPLRQSTLGGVSVGIPANSKHKDAAWEFIKYRLKKEVQLRASTLGLSMPAVREAATSPEFLTQERPAHLRYFVEALSYTRPFPTFPGFEDVDGNAISPQLARLWRGEVSAQQALEAATMQGNALLKGSRPYRP